MSDINFLEEQSRKLLGSLSTSLVDTVSSDDTLNPMKALMSGLLDSNAFAAIDPTTVQGPLLDMLKLVDLSTESNALGEQVPEGVALGVNSGAATSLSPSALSPLREALTSAVASLFQIRSPARIMMEPGRQIPAGIAVGILSNKGAVVGAIREVYGAAIREAQIQEAALRRAMATLLGGGPGGTPGSTVNNNDNSSNATVNVSQMVVRADSDAAVIASQIAALNRRTLAGYGARA